MRIDPRTRRVEHTIALDAFPNGMAAGREAIWVVDAYASSVIRISADTNAVLRALTMPYDPLRYEHGCSASPGAVRASIAAGLGEVRAVCPSGVQTIVDVQSSRARASDAEINDASAVAYGLGSVWIASRADNTVSQIDPLTGATQRTITVALRPVALEVAYGSVWVASQDDDAVSRIRFPGPALPPTLETIHVGKAPIAIAAGEGGIWVANSGDHTVSRIDPQTDRVTATIKIGRTIPSGVAAGNGAVWVTAQSE
jgi:YVTN family beta-propeller protein